MAHNMIMKSEQIHWNRVYQNKLSQALGWYEAQPQLSLAMIQSCVQNADARILMVGAGTSTLVEALLKAGYRNLIVNDLSAIALQKLEAQIEALCSDQNFLEPANVSYIVDDLTAPQKLLDLTDQVDLWQDRAVLHFFTGEVERQAYKKLLNQVLKPEGHALIATFYPNTALRCSGLPVRHYNAQDLSDFLGKEFYLKAYQREMYIMPSGDKREFGYGLFQRS